MPGGNSLCFLQISREEGLAGQDVDNSRNPLAEGKNAVNCLLVEKRSLSPRGSQTVLDILFDLLPAEGAKLIIHPDALSQLPHLRELNRRPQPQLPCQNKLKSLS